MEGCSNTITVLKSWELEGTSIQLQVEGGVLSALVQDRLSHNMQSIDHRHLWLIGLEDWHSCTDLSSWLETTSVALTRRKRSLFLEIWQGQSFSDVDEGPTLLVEGEAAAYPIKELRKNPYFQQLVKGAVAPVELEGISRLTFRQIVSHISGRRVSTGDFLISDWIALCCAAHRFQLSYLQSQCVGQLTQLAEMHVASLLNSPDLQGGWSPRVGVAKAERRNVVALLEIWNAGEALQLKELIEASRPQRPWHPNLPLYRSKSSQYQTAGGGQVTFASDGTSRYDFGGGTLMWAIRSGCAELLPILSQGGSSQLGAAFIPPHSSLGPRNERSPVMRAIGSGHGEVIRYLLAQPNIVHLFEGKHLQYAGEKGQWRIFDNLLSALKQRSATPIRKVLEGLLTEAVESRDHESIAHLLGKGRRYFPPDNPPEAAYTSLIEGNQPGFLMLWNALKMNLSTQRKGSGSTFLHLATKCDHLSLFRFLKEQGGDLNRVDDQGRTPLHLAAQVGNPRMVSELLKAGADPLIEDGEYHLASDLASLERPVSERREDYGKVLTMLRRAERVRSGG